jgi:hypothetical protein
MAENKENISGDQKTESEEREVHIEPSEPKTSKTADPGRTPGKAEGADDESATD